MRIAVNISPLENSHKFRGTGSYTRMLYDNLQNFDKVNSYYFFYDINKIPENVDIIHYPFFNPFAFSFSLRYLRKTLITIHDLTPLVFPEHFPCGIKGNMIWSAQKFFLKRTYGIITDSFSSKKDIAKIVDIPEEKINIVYLAAGQEFKAISKKSAGWLTLSENIRIKYNLPEKFLLYVGDVTWNKNIPNLVQAVKKIDIPLVLVGNVWGNNSYNKNNPWNKDRLMVESLTDNDKKFIKLGFIPLEDIVILYNLATSSIMPSFYEGFGLPILEAMRCGCPVITTACGSLPEVAGNAAYFVNPNDVAAIAEGIKKVTDNKNLQKELSEKGIKQVEKYTVELTVKKTIQAYTSYVKR